MSLLDGFLVRAVLAGIGTALAAAPLGVFVVWRRLAYFGDATAHAALLGVALALASDLPVAAGALVTALLMGAGVWALARRGLAADTALGVLAHGALATGVIAMAFAGGRVDLEAYLFGDVLAVRAGDLAVIWGGAALVAAGLAWRWRRLLTASLDPDLARAAGIDPAREELALTLALALVVAVALKIVGALLVTALLIMPAAAARPFARSPEAMLVLATLAGVAAVALGLTLAWRLDLPAGPAIVTAAGGLFVLSQSGAALRPCP